MTVACAPEPRGQEKHVREIVEPDSAIRTQLVRLMRDLEPGRRHQDDTDHVTLGVLRQLILHTVWLAEEVRVLQDEVDRLNDIG